MRDKRATSSGPPRSSRIRHYRTTNRVHRYIEQIVLARAYSFGAQVQRRMRNMADAIYEVGFNNTDTIFLIFAF